MSERAATVAEQRAINSEARKRSPLVAFIPVVVLIIVDVALSLAAFAISYKLRHHADMFVWRPRKSSWPIGIYHDFEPYLSFLVFSPLVKIYMLHRYGLYKLRGEFSFGNDFAKIASASTLASLVLVLIAFIFRQGFSYRDGHWISLDFSYSRLVFVYYWLIAIWAIWVTRATVRVIQILRSEERRGG